MAPVNLMCTRFLKSLLVREDKLVQAEREDSKDDDTDEDETMHSDDSDWTCKLKMRICWNCIEQKMKKLPNNQMEIPF